VSGTSCRKERAAALGKRARDDEDAIVGGAGAGAAALSRFCALERSYFFLGRRLVAVVAALFAFRATCTDASAPIARQEHRARSK